jgi:pimeloyl-ACP methyl ester carboxylesterase
MADLTTTETVLWAGGAGVAFLYALPRIIAILRARPASKGDPDEGIVIFAESLRWLGVRWGRCEAEAGLRQAGFRGAFEFWDWDPTWRAVLVLPTIAAPRFLEAQARRLAEHIAELRRGRPGRPIHVMGYSAGGYVAVRAVELLPADVKVDSCSLLAAAFSPWRDLNVAAANVTGRLVVGWSAVDVVVGLGTAIVGTADRVFTPSIGAIGYRGPRCEKLIQIPWRPAHIRLGHWGSHMTAPARGLIANCIAPAAGIR